MSETGQAAEAPSPDRGLGAAARGLVELLSRRGSLLVAAESCTGGLLASAVTAVPGASAVLWGSIVSYGEEAKRGLLGVDAATLATAGAVSTETALAMLAGALALSAPEAEGRPPARGADLGLAITGWAGPGAGAGEEGPGRVFIAWGRRGERPWVLERRYGGDRQAVRIAAATDALRGARLLAEGEKPDREALPAAWAAP